MIRKVRHCCETCENLVCVTTTIGQLQHSEYLKPTFLDTFKWAIRLVFPETVTFKGKRELKKLKIPRGVVVKVQSKGWNDATLTKVWLQKVLLQHTKKQQALLVWDTFKGHLTDELESELRKSNIITAVIPGGCTSKIQPFDVCINRPFKNNFHASWMSYIQESVSHLENWERLQPPSKQQVVNWLLQLTNA